MTAFKQFWDNVSSLWSLIVGLKITGKFGMDKLITVHYPRETVSDDDLLQYRGHVELVGKPKSPDKPKCIACMMCVTVCPSKCFTVVKAKAPKQTEEELQAMKEAEERGEKVVKPKAPKEPVKFVYDYSLCSLCGSCVENCPVGSLRYSENVYFASTDRKDFKMNLLERLKTQAGRGEAETSSRKD